MQRKHEDLPDALIDAAIAHDEAGYPFQLSLAVACQQLKDACVELRRHRSLWQQFRAELRRSRAARDAINRELLLGIVDAAGVGPEDDTTFGRLKRLLPDAGDPLIHSIIETVLR